MQVMTENSDFMRIRKYIVNTIAANAPRPVKFPPLSTLAKKFGVSKPTVLRVIRSLIEDNYLLPCKGGGTISSPNQSTPNSWHTIFGYIVHSGDQSVECRFFSTITSAMKDAITFRNSKFVAAQLNYGPLECMERALVDNVVNYLVLVAPSNSMQKQLPVIRKLGIPAVSFIYKLEGVSSVYLSMLDMLTKSLEKLRSEGRKKIIVFTKNDEVCFIPPENKFPDLNQKDILQYKIGTMAMNEAIFHDLSGRLERGEVFDGVYFSFLDPVFYHLLRQKLDLKAQCRCIAQNTSITRDLNFEGYVISPDLAYASEQLVDLLLNPPEKNADIKIPFQIETYNQK